MLIGSPAKFTTAAEPRMQSLHSDSSAITIPGKSLAVHIKKNFKEQEEKVNLHYNRVMRKKKRTNLRFLFIIWKIISLNDIQHSIYKFTDPRGKFLLYIHCFSHWKPNKG